MFGLRLVTALLLAGFVAACSGPRTLPSYWRTGIPNLFAYAGGDNDILVLVAGNPFDATDAELAQNLADVLSEGPYSPPTRFVARPNKTIRPGYYWIFVFDPAPMVFGQTLCVADLRSPALTMPKSDPARTRLTAVFCAADRTVSEVEASFPKTTALTDPMVKETFARIGQQLAPPYDPLTIIDCPNPLKC